MWSETFLIFTNLVQVRPLSSEYFFELIVYYQ